MILQDESSAWFLPNNILSNILSDIPNMNPSLLAYIVLRTSANGAYLMKYLKRGIFFELIGLFLLFCLFPLKHQPFWEANSQTEKDYIKWVDFNVSVEALNQAYQYDISTYDAPVHLNWIELLAYAAAKNGGSFSAAPSKEVAALADALTAEEASLEELTQDLKYYPYYLEAYSAVLGGWVGEYELEEEGGWVKKYGLKAFSPIAKNFPYSDYDDFGAARSYGYKRPHLGHDMMGQTGTPIIAVESGYVEAIGWNQYGGWRLGIRSFDKKRYYYYAHLRQNFPYCKELKEGSIVIAGDVIGYD